MPKYSFAASSNPWPAVGPAANLILWPHYIFGTSGDDSFTYWWDKTPPAGKYFSFHLGGGDDTAAGSEYGDAMYGGDGDDELWGRGGNDSLFGGADNDFLYGDAGTWGLTAGNDFLDGGDGNDALYGDGGNDWLKGGSGTDLLDGGEGNDVLEGGAGYDVLQGGPGADRYVLTDKNNVDLIKGVYAYQGDTIDISALLDESNFTGAGTGTPSENAYFQGYYTFGYVQSSNTTVVFVDLDGAAGPGGDYAVADLFNVNPGSWADLLFIV